MLPMTRGATTTSADGRDVVDWSAAIPGNAVTTSGVDYFLEAEDELALTRVPGGTFVGVNPVPDTDPPDAGYWHVHTVTPPLVAHQPPPFAPSDQPIPLTIQVACSTGNCNARMYYRTNTGPITDEQVAAENGELIATPDWPSVQMQQQPGATQLGQAGQLLTFTAQVPASYVDTRGVDYFFEVSDGSTQAWSPGSTYQGYYAPTDGMRTGYWHVHVLEPSHLVHVPVTSAPYRQPIAITAHHGNCPATRTCTARLYYRTTTSNVLDPTPAFASTPMVVTTTPGVGGTNAISVTGTIPATVADTRGVDYFFSVSDGATTTWWPGTSRVDGYVPVDGTQVGYQHIRVLEPPHIIHTPVPTALFGQPLTINAQLTCATEQCHASLVYTSDPNSGPSSYRSVAMTKTATGISTPVGRTETWQVTIPGAEVTTRGFAYAIVADDGYTTTWAPGTFYWGAYYPTDGQPITPGANVDSGGNPSASISVGDTTTIEMFPVHVIEPPHLAHIPPGTATAGQPLDLRADATCSTPSCVATLHWLRSNGTWTSTTMNAANTATGIAGNDLITYSATIPAADVAPGLQHWIEVNDGYVTDRTPTWPTQVQ